MDECISEGDSWSPLHRLCLMCGYDLYSSRLIFISPDAAVVSCVKPPNPGIADADCATNIIRFNEKSPARSSLAPGPFLSAVFPCRGAPLRGEPAMSL